MSRHRWGFAVHRTKAHVTVIKGAKANPRLWGRPRPRPRIPRGTVVIQVGPRRRSR